MAKETIEILIDGGKATPGPPLGPALGPYGVNMMQIVDEINKKTADFEGMKVPFENHHNTETKEFEIKVGNTHNSPNNGRIASRKIRGTRHGQVADLTMNSPEIG